MIDHSFTLKSAGYNWASEGKTAALNRLTFSMAEDFPMMVLTVVNSISMGEPLSWLAVVSPCLSFFFIVLSVQTAAMSFIKLNAGDRNLQLMNFFIGMVAHLPFVALLYVYM